MNIHADIDTKIINIEKIRGIESASESLRAAGLKCISIRPWNRVCLRLQSGSEVSSNYRGIQPIVTRFPPENRVRLSEADRMRKEGKKHGKTTKREKKRDRQRRRYRATGSRAKEAIPTVTRNGDT